MEEEEKVEEEDEEDDEDEDDEEDDDEEDTVSWYKNGKKEFIDVGFDGKSKSIVVFDIDVFAAGGSGE